jgi:hypothetical protein
MNLASLQHICLAGGGGVKERFIVPGCTTTARKVYCAWMYACTHTDFLKRPGNRGEPIHIRRPCPYSPPPFDTCRYYDQYLYLSIWQGMIVIHHAGGFTENGFTDTWFAFVWFTKTLSTFVCFTKMWFAKNPLAQNGTHEGNRRCYQGALGPSVWG